MAGILRHRTTWSLTITCLFIVANGGIWLTINGSYKDMAPFEQENFFSWKIIGINVVLYSPNQIHRYIGPYLKMFNCLKKEAACYPETSVIFTTLHSIMSLKRYFSKLPPSEFHITLKITQQTFFFFTKLKLYSSSSSSSFSI